MLGRQHLSLRGRRRGAERSKVAPRRRLCRAHRGPCALYTGRLRARQRLRRGRTDRKQSALLRPAAPERGLRLARGARSAAPDLRGDVRGPALRRAAVAGEEPEADAATVGTTRPEWKKRRRRGPSFFTATPSTRSHAGHRAACETTPLRRALSKRHANGGLPPPGRRRLHGPARVRDVPAFSSRSWFGL